MTLIGDYWSVDIEKSTWALRSLWVKIFNVDWGTWVIITADFGKYFGDFNRGPQNTRNTQFICFIVLVGIPCMYDVIMTSS